MFKSHPKALPYLFFSEMWERFGYYLMIGIFTFYLKDVKQGFDMNEKQSADLYGTFIALVFLTPFVGGLIADRYLGYKKSVIIGGIFMGIGYICMSIHHITALYFAMFMVIIGNGFFKPNISTLLGNIYTGEKHKHQKDEGYNIFYMGINIGAFICNFCAAVLQNIYGYSAAFIAAGIGMFIGVIIFISGSRHYSGFEEKKGIQPGDMPLSKIVLTILLPSVVFGIVGWLIKGVESALNKNASIFGSDSTDAFIFSCIPVIYFYASIYFKANADEKKSIGAMYTIFIVVILFWAVFKQNGTALNTWADKYTDRSVSANISPYLSKLQFLETIEMKQKSLPVVDNHFRKQKDKNDTILKALQYPHYYNNSDNHETVEVWLPNMSQSINPGWIIILTPLVVGFFTFLRRKNKEPKTATKIALGLLISALSALVMVAAVKAGNNGIEKVSVWWLISCYGVITIGELLLSPMGLSMVSKLSPPAITSLLMGGWFLSTSIGNKLSGVLASLWDTYDDKSNFFLLNFVLLLIAAIVLFLMLKKLNATMDLQKKQ